MKKTLTFVLVVIMVLSLAASAMAASMLKQGDRGAAVKQLQAKLRDGGWADLKVDGIYGPQTAEAVKYWQKMNGRKQTGVADAFMLGNLLGTNEVDVNPNGGNSLEFGSSGIAVRDVQMALSSRGYPVGAIDGKFGKKTEAAVKSFQALNGLKVDGKVGAKTLAALNSSGAIAYHKVVTYTTLRRGASGDAVMKLQQALAAKGFWADEFTGYYGQTTVIAVQNFQIANGLKVDGIAGQQTLSALYGP